MAAGSLPLPTGRPGQALAVALLLAVAALAWSSVAAPLTDLYASRAESLAQRTVLARRMAQAAADLPALQQASSRFVAAGPPPAALLSGASDAVAGATLQQQRNPAGRAGRRIPPDRRPGGPLGALAGAGQPAALDCGGVSGNAGR